MKRGPQPIEVPLGGNGSHIRIKEKKKLFSILEFRVMVNIPKSMSKISTRAPLLLAPNAKALPAPPAPTSTNSFPARGELKDASPLVHPCSVIFRMYNCWHVSFYD